MTSYITLKRMEEIIGDNLMPIQIESLNDDKFLKVRETLTRIGIKSKKDGKNTLIQSAHVLKKRDKYYIVHFKHMFLLDGHLKSTKINEEDISRIIYISQLLESWGLINIIKPITNVNRSNIHVIPYKDKSNWILEQKYEIASNKIK